MYRNDNLVASTLNNMGLHWGWDKHFAEKWSQQSFLCTPGHEIAWLYYSSCLFFRIIWRTCDVTSCRISSKGSSAFQNLTTCPSGPTRNFQKFHLGVFSTESVYWSDISQSVSEYEDIGCHKQAYLLCSRLIFFIDKFNKSHPMIVWKLAHRRSDKIANCCFPITCLSS